MQGLKRKRRCQNQCFQHLFSLRNLINNPKYDIQLAFCPKYQRQPLPPQHTFSEYNNDGLFYTSAFVLGVDKKLVAKNLQKEMIDHQKLIKENCQKYNQIVFPRPNSKHTTCSVCKQTYKNYYLHIFSDQHSDKIQSSAYNYCIKQLCSLFKDLWDGCAEKADQQAVNQTEKSRIEAEQRISEELNLDGILQQEDINSNPSQLQSYKQQKSQDKQVVMRRPVRVYEYINPTQPARILEDRNSRKKNMNFAQFFQECPRKKVINDHRQAVTVSCKKLYKMPQIQQKKSNQIAVINKSDQVQVSEPFIIEYNARARRKQKKSYYYLKKKQRQERQQRERQIFLGQMNDQNKNKNTIKRQLSQQQISQINQDQIQKYSDDQYEKHIEEFNQEQKQNRVIKNDIRKNILNDVILFQQVEKKRFPIPIFQNIQNNDDKTLISQRILINSVIKGQNPLQKISVNPGVNPVKKTTESLACPSSVMQKASSGQAQLSQQISDKNKLNKLDYSHQNELPLYHKFKNPLQKQVTTQNEFKPQKDTQQVFNQYEQKFRQYQRQKQYSLRHKIYQKRNAFEQKRNAQHFFNNQQSTLKAGKGYIQRQFQETYQYGNQKDRLDQPNKLGMSYVKKEDTRNNSFSLAYFKKNQAQKQVCVNLPIKAINPTALSYSDPHQLYSPYRYPVPAYGQPIHDPQKADRLPIKYEQQRQNQAFDRGYYYGAWQPPYYINPPGTVIPVQMDEVEGTHKSYPVSPYSNSKRQNKPMGYPSYPSGYPGYSPTSYPGYYPATGGPYPPAQRPQFSSHLSPSMRGPPQSNTSININFPMYLGHPYQGGYQYQPDPQRYAQQPPRTTQGQYSPPSQPQTKPTQSQPYPPVYSTNALRDLPPYAEYQEYKKRQNQRRR